MQLVPRTPVIPLDGVLGDPCEGLYLTPWPEFLSFERVMGSYARENMVATGASSTKLKRFGYVAKDLLRVFDPQKPIEAFERNDGRRYAEIRMAEGIIGATVARELTFAISACNHAKREGRTKHEFKLWKPEPSPPRLRVLNHEEERRLMLAPKARRTQLFLLLAFNTGARARAIEEATWDRVDLERRTIDYRVPGVAYKNKRRVVAPINDYLLRRLESAYQLRQDEYVIGRGPRGKVSTTYHDVKQAYRFIGLVEDGMCRHVTRHTFATRLLRNRVPIAEVAKLLGDTIAMVEKVYGHLVPSDMMYAVNLLHAA